MTPRDDSAIRKVTALYDNWNAGLRAGVVDQRTQNGMGYAEAWREATVALGSALGLVDIENPIAPGEDE